MQDKIEALAKAQVIYSKAEEQFGLVKDDDFNEERQQRGTDCCEAGRKLARASIAIKEAAIESYRTGKQLPSGVSVKTELGYYGELEAIDWCITYARSALKLDKEKFEKLARTILSLRRKETVLGDMSTALTWITSLKDVASIDEDELYAGQYLREVDNDTGQD